MLPRIELDHSSDVPLYRQLHEQLRSAIIASRMVRGERLPATRELAGSLGLNRATVASAYELLETEHLIKAHVGRGSFVEGAEAAKLDWESLIPTEDSGPAPVSPNAAISFAASRPSQDEFPLDEFRRTCREVIDSDEAPKILQLGPASGYGPLRRLLLDEARRRGFAREDDDILITSGCQQAFDLIQRVLASRGETVIMEDPVYPGLRNVFQRGGARVHRSARGRRRRRRGSARPADRKRAPAPDGADAEFPESDRHHDSRGIAPRNSGHGPPRRRCDRRKRSVRRAALSRAGKFRPSSSWMHQATRFCWAVFRRSRFPDCGSAGPSVRGTSSRV